MQRDDAIEKTEKIEDVILRYSERGMQELRPYLSENCCHIAAKEILSWEKGTVFLTTGFYVAGVAETDGPVGTAALAKALQTVGYHPVMITDQMCEGYFESEELETIYIDFHSSDEELSALLKKYRPVGMISVERCGVNQNGSYANMRGVDISEHTAPVDRLFVLCRGMVPTIGVGDGGNEIGMGKIPGVIRRKLDLCPCMVATDILVIASVSNWGAYGIVAALERMTKKVLLPDIQWVLQYIRRTVDLGSVDGVTKKRTETVDGKDMQTEMEILSALKIAG